MKKLIIIILIVLVAQACYAKTMKVVTGYGYFKDKSGDIVAKTRLAPGTYPLSDKDLEYVEVASAQALNAVEVYVEPPSEEQVAKDKAARRKQILSDLDLTEDDLTKLKALI